MNNISTVITRTRRIENEKFYLTSNAIKSSYDGKWSNCLYIHFCKEDFPQLTYAPLIDCNWYANQKKRFEYNTASVASLDWHGGITFYEETTSGESGRTYVKAGCDYQHLYDDDYQMSDHGEELLNIDANAIIEGFKQLTGASNKDVTNAK